MLDNPYTMIYTTPFGRFATRYNQENQQNTPLTPQPPDTPFIALQRIEQSLAVLCSAVDEINQQNATEGLNGSALVWLQSNARTIETAMRQIRNYEATTTPAGIELAQALTVLVLIADMISSGHIERDQDNFTLLRRNATRAAGCLYSLRQQFDQAERLF